MAEPKRESLHVVAVVELSCCNVRGDVSIDREVGAAGGGAELHKYVCHTCGAEYLLGVIAKTREESLASEVFEHLSEEEEQEIGIDRNDFEPSADEPRMCAKCDGSCTEGDRCRGCNEYVHAACRTRVVSRTPHQADEHWQEPKFESVETRAESDDDDGSRLTGDDFIAERD